MSSTNIEPRKRFTRYGQLWGAGESDITVELACIALGGKWKNKKGEDCGLGLFEHFMNARKLIWPDRYRHRWTDLMYREFIANDITILMGCASAQKTSMAVEFGLLNWWAKPEKTLVIMSTVNMDKLDIGIWAELKMLWEAGKEREPLLPGFLLEHKRSITLDSSKESGKSRDFRQGMICRPCYTGGRWQGLGVLAGTKQENIIYVADELQFMQDAFAMSWPHLFANGRVKIIGSGNPKHDPEDQLALAGEPKEGWHSHPEPEKTEVYDCKFMGGRCINLVGTDSPNFDVPEGEPAPFPGLISRNFAKRIEHDHGRGSFEYYKLVKGVMRVQFAQARVITRQLCRDHHALEKAEWGQGERHRIYALDPTYGGDDRCVGTPIEFGPGMNGQMLLRVMPYRVFPFDLRSEVKVEDQLANLLDGELNLYGIKPEDCFYDSVGKGTIGAAFARKFGFKVPVAVDTGAKPTKRPVRHDLFVVDATGQKRLKRCDEHYSKFVSELWFSVRECIEAGQMRELPEDVMLEGCARIYEHVGGNRIEVEPKSDPKKKEDLKRRLGKSPDLFDCWVSGTLVTTQRGNIPIEDVVVGDMARTPFGFEPVVMLHKQYVTDITEVSFSDGRTLEGKGGHRVFVKTQGWVRLDTLTIANECESEYDLPVWNLLNSLFAKDESIGFKQLADIIKTKTGAAHTRDFYIELSGLSTMGLFQKACVSIIKMASGGITGLPIWSWLRSAITRGIIFSKGWLTRLKKSFGLETNPSPWKRLLSGITPMPEGNGTAQTLAINGNKESPEGLFAWYAAMPSRRPAFRPQNSVPLSAPTKMPEKSTKTIRGFVKFAALLLWRSGMIRRRTAPVTVQQLRLQESKPVYNLSVAGSNVYYANGILVENCLTIGVEGARQRGFQITRLGSGVVASDSAEDWIDEEAKEYEDAIKSSLLVHQ